MTIIEIARKVVAEKSAYVIRPRIEQGIEVALDAKPWGMRDGRRGWTILDLFSASIVVSVHDSINEENQKRLNRLPFMTAVGICLKLAKVA